MVSGHWLHLPEPGSMLEQTSWIMDCIEQARRAWMIWSYKPANDIQWSTEDRDYMAWVGNGDK
jgi:L-arabinose isomerase